MIIQTLGKKYTVIKYNDSDGNTENYICEGIGGEKYTVVRIKSKMWIMKAMEFLMRQADNSHFTDFVSCFASEGYFHVVMKYTEGISLKEKLQRETCSMEERMAVFKAVLDRIMILDMPDYFLWDCLHEESIILSPSFEVSFRYHLSHINRYDSISFCEVQTCLCRLFGQLLEQELKRKVIPLFAHFLNSLKKGKYQKMLEVYKEYDALCEEIKRLPPVESVIPDTWGFRTWERIRRLITPVKKICAIFLLFLSIAFLIYSAYESMQEGVEKRTFEYIGTLEIKEGGE